MLRTRLYVSALTASLPHVAKAHQAAASGFPKDSATAKNAATARVKPPV